MSLDDVVWHVLSPRAALLCGVVAVAFGAWVWGRRGVGDA